MRILERVTAALLVLASSTTIPVAVVRNRAPEPITETTSATVEVRTMAYITEDLGEFKVTAYCGCAKCCGSYAKDRPTDRDGQPIVYTASGERARAGCTVAADTSVLPFGTVLIIDGRVYKVQDTGSAVKGKHIDIYFSTHQQALEWGCQTKTVERYVG